jgi:beta-phosphoglucomutase family hydrolase
MPKPLPEQRIKGFIFDMDGTIVDSMPVHLCAWTSFLSSQGITLTPEMFEAKNRGTIREIITAFFGTGISAARRDALGAEKEALFRSMYRGKVKPVSGFPEFLRRAHAAGMKLGLASMANRANVDLVLDALGLRPFFHAIVNGDDVARGKPHPEVFNRALSQLSLLPQEALVFEDAASGIQAASAAGIKAIGLTTTHSGRELMEWGAEKAIADFDEIDPSGPFFRRNPSG